MKRSKKLKMTSLGKMLLSLLIIFLIVFGFSYYHKNFKPSLPNKDKQLKPQDDLANNPYIKLGYSKEELKYIEQLSSLNKEKLLQTTYIDLKNFYNVKNFNVNNINRYLEFAKKNPDKTYQDIITLVNINNDLEVYVDTFAVKNPDDLLVIVNKYYYLDKNYKPQDLGKVNGVVMRQVLIEDFKALQKAAKEEINIILLPTTAYRDYQWQNSLYTTYVRKDGKAKADTYSARPGFSEHQTGLAIDLKNKNIKNKRLNDSDISWLHKNIFKYGFILRYPKDKENITKYQYEYWHIRYVGKEIAKIIYENNLTLEEYVDLYVTKY